MISKRVQGRKDRKSSAADALAYGEGLKIDKETGEVLDKSHRTRLGNFGLVDDGVYAGRSVDEMAEIINFAAIEMQANCDQNTRVGPDKRMAHFVVSYRDEKPSEAVLRDTEDSMLAALGLEKNHFATFLHNDNGYWHLHIFASLIEKEKPHRGNPLWHDRIKRDKVCREIEARHGLEQDNGMHAFDGLGNLVEVPKAERIAKQGTRPISDRAKTTEIYSGEKSFQTWCEEIRIGDRLKHAKSWNELHATAAAYNCEIKQKGAGFVVCPVGEKGGIQLSKVGMKNLPAKFGSFEPALPGLGQGRQAQVGYKAGPTQEKAETHYTKWRKARDTFKPHKTERINALREEHGRMRKLLNAQHRAEIAGVRATSRGQGRFTAVSIAKMNQAVALAGLTAQFAQERHALRDELAAAGPGNTFRDFLVAEAGKGDTVALGLARRYGEKEATAVSRQREADQLQIVAAVHGKERRPTRPLKFTHQVQRNGTVVFDLGAGRRVTDSAIAKQVQLNDAAAHSPEVIATALRFAASKFGNTLSLTGTQEFQRLAVETAVRNRLSVTFADPALEAHRQAFAAQEFATRRGGVPVPDFSHLTPQQIAKGVTHVLNNTLDRGRPPEHVLRAEQHRQLLAADGGRGVHDLPAGGVDAQGQGGGVLLPNPLHGGVGNAPAGQDTHVRRTGTGAPGGGGNSRADAGTGSADILIPGAGRGHVRPDGVGRAEEAGERGRLPVTPSLPTPAPVPQPQRAPEPVPVSPMPESTGPVDTAAELATARAALLKELRADGLEVLPVVDGRLFIGKIRKIADPHFAVQGVGQRAVVIHELGQLEGQYAAGQLAEIKYREGRGNDLLQVTERSRKRPGPER